MMLKQLYRGLPLLYQILYQSLAIIPTFGLTNINLVTFRF